MFVSMKFASVLLLCAQTSASFLLSNLLTCLLDSLYSFAFNSGILPIS